MTKETDIIISLYTIDFFKNNSELEGTIFRIQFNNKGPFTQCDNICDNVNSFSMRAMGSMESNGSVPMGTCISNFYCDIDFNGELFFDAVANAP